MIATIHGTVQRIAEESIVVQVGGVGLALSVTNAVYNRPLEVGKPVELWTYLVVREDDLALYGFNNEEEKSIFEMLLSVSGIGPRLGLAVLDTLSPEMLANAIQQDDPDVISRVPGIGKKTAQKIILELKGKLLPETLPAGVAMISSLDTEVMDALTAMGFSIVEAQAALQSIPSDAPEDIEERVRLALGYFSS